MYRTFDIINFGGLQSCYANKTMMAQNAFAGAAVSNPDLRMSLSSHAVRKYSEYSQGSENSFEFSV